MTERDRSPVDVDDRLIELEQASRVRCDPGERLVDLDEPQVRGGSARLLECLLHREGRDRVQRRVPIGRHPVGDDLGERLDTEPLDRRVRGDHDGARAVADLRGVARGHGSVRRERRPQPRERLRRAVRSDPLVTPDLDDLAP